MILHEKIAEQLPAWRERVAKLVKEHGDVVVDQVTIAQVYGGMRDIKSLVTDISFVDPATGIKFRGLSIPEVLEQLPKPDGANIPYVGAIFYLLLIGEVPTKEQAEAVEAEWARRAEVPGYVYDVLRAMPTDTHPMVLFSQAVLALERTSEFTRRYHEGMKKDTYWEPTLEDALNLTAKAPVIAAFIYRWKYGDKQEPRYQASLDFGANFARMLGVPDKGYEDLSRLYFILHSDHELGNVSAHATHLVGSALSDAYYAFSAGLNGLAGPLHGLANQECLAWLISVRDRFGGVPTRQQLYDFAWETLNSGKVIPGYGHAVLRVTDPRFTAQLEYAKKHFPEDTLVQIAELVYEVVPQVLKEQGKAKNPAPNVDAISGTLQYYYGVREFDFYTVLFGVGRSLGVMANLVWARALGQPIERPKSVTTAMLEDAAAQA
ncbi:MAG: citrate (Si)-synthase [Anaerolineales bacterium]|nr:citrate (Si)-synthase [Anaerolineales bacterium]MDW8227966.1 citrate (Si)-synthase [Anaerolineales bacterium]